MRANARARNSGWWARRQPQPSAASAAWRSVMSRGWAVKSARPPTEVGVMASPAGIGARCAGRVAARQCRPNLAEAACQRQPALPCNPCGTRAGLSVTVAQALPRSGGRRFGRGAMSRNERTVRASREAIVAVEPCVALDVIFAPAGSGSDLGKPSPDRTASGTSADNRQGGSAGTRELNAAVRNQTAASPEDVHRRQEGRLVGVAVKAGRYAQSDRQRVVAARGAPGAAPGSDGRATRVGTELENVHALPARRRRVPRLDRPRPASPRARLSGAPASRASAGRPCR